MTAREQNQESAPALPDDERRALSSGITFALACAAALSAPTLYQLARLIGYAPQLAWLLPAAFDGYAATSIWVGRRIPRVHPAAKAARRNARLALAMTICCNGLYHLLALAGSAIPGGVHIGLLVVVSSLPPFIVDRLLHLNAIANGTTTTPAVQPQAPSVALPTPRPMAPPAALPEAPPAPLPVEAERRHTEALSPSTQSATAPPAAIAAEAPPPPEPATRPRATAARQRQRPGATVTELGTSGGLSLPQWAELAAPVYEELMRRDGVAPSAPKLMDELVRRGCPPVKAARARLVRKAAEDRLGLTGEGADEPEPADEITEEAS